MKSMNPGCYKLSVNNQLILRRCVYNDSFLFRTKGLLGRSQLEEEEGILLQPCKSIHMFFMRFPIDAIFVDKDFKIQRIYHAIKPWRISGLCFGAQGVVEMTAGRAALFGLGVGDRIYFSMSDYGN